MDNNTLPKGFISIDDAIKLIESDTRQNPVVDVQFLVNNLPFMRPDFNYTIKLLKRDEESGKIVSNGTTFVTVTNDWEKAKLEHAILQHFKQATGRELDPKMIGIRHLTTENDDSMPTANKIRNNDKPITKVGERIGGGTKEVAA